MDGTDKTADRGFVRRIERYFTMTMTGGKQRSRWIVPVPLFVESDMTGCPLCYPLLRALPFLGPFGPWAASEAGCLTSTLQIPQDPPHHVPADAGARSLKVKEREAAIKASHGILYQLPLGAADRLDLPHSFLEQPVCPRRAIVSC
jgi:hypothetical protein